VTESGKILVVDDNDAGRYVKQHILAQAGYDVSVAGSGLDTLRAVISIKPDIILLDVHLPDTSGVEVCRKIRDDRINVAILMTSAAFTEPADRAIALTGGADSYLIEPIDPNELLAAVAALLRMRRAEQELRLLNETLEQRIAERTHELALANDSLEIARKKAARAEEALWHSQKLEAIGQLTGGIAHDFNNLLTVVLGNLEMIEKGIARIPGAERIFHYLQASRRAAQDCADLTRQLLVFARRNRLRLQIVDVNKSIEGVGNFIRRSVGEQIIFDTSLAPDLWSSQIDPTQLEAALLNLAVNARDAMPHGGTLHIVTNNVRIGSEAEHTADGPPRPPDIVGGDYVAISVIDTGTGMSDDVIDHAFEPFFTTKDVGKGSGLGLSQVFGFVRQSGGYIGLDSTVGEGTRFAIFLPRSEEKASGQTLSTGPTEDAPHGTGTVLVVEDNDLVLEYAVTLISDLGYHVLCATNGTEALDVIKRGEPVDLLFTDVVMPNGMSGIELAHEVQQLRPDVKVLITSGYAGRMAPAEGRTEFMSIAKPYRSAELAKRLHEVLTH
jgi:signal transduction histidine kinase